MDVLPGLLSLALSNRQAGLTEPHNTALRLFNGFYEGFPSLVVDLYGRTLVVFTHKVGGEESHDLAQIVREVCLPNLDWIDCILLKQRSAVDAAGKQGGTVYGTLPDTSIVENGVTYALDLVMNQDAGFYLDTRGVRTWLKENAGGRSILNTFAYTGSLGVAALAGGAARVVQIDRNRKFLEMAQKSAGLNELTDKNMKCIPVDFFVGVGQIKQRRESFDIVVLDPPYFSVTDKGRVDLVTESARLVNKVRPLVKDGGKLVVVNNALFLSGADFVHGLEELGRGGFLSIDETIPIPEDFTGYPETRVGRPPADPAPFNHSTKIAVLTVRQKGKTDDRQ